MHDNDNVIDIGCGNGRFLEVIGEKNISYTGVDISKDLIKIAKEKYDDTHTFYTANALHLPTPSEHYDIAYSFAVLHHIPSHRYRAQFIREAARILKPDGTFVLTVWNLWQKKFLSEIFSQGLNSLFCQSPLDPGDLLLTFGKDKHKRYLHAFTKRKLERLLSRNGFRILSTDTIYRKSGHSNIVIVGKKL